MLRGEIDGPSARAELLKGSGMVQKTGGLIPVLVWEDKAAEREFKKISRMIAELERKIAGGR